MIIDNQNALQSWLVKILASLSEANPDALSKYVLALIKKDKSEKDLRKICIEQLDVFLQNETETFVQKLFDTIRTESYKLVGKEKTLTKQKEQIFQKAYTIDVETGKRKYVSSEATSEEYTDESESVDEYKSINFSRLNSIECSNIGSTPLPNQPLQNKKSSITVIKNEDFIQSNLHDNMTSFTKESSLDSYVSESEQKVTESFKERSNLKTHNPSLRKNEEDVMDEDELAVSRNSHRFGDGIDVDFKRRHTHHPSTLNQNTEQLFRRNNRGPSRRRKREGYNQSYETAHHPSTIAKMGDFTDDIRASVNEARHSNNNKRYHRKRPPSPNFTVEDNGRRDVHDRSWAGSRQQLYSRVATNPDCRIPGIDFGLAEVVEVTEEGIQMTDEDDDLPKRTIPSTIVRKRCADYDEKGFCMQGDMCPYDHGNDPVIVRDLNMFRPPPSAIHKTQNLTNSPVKDTSPLPRSLPPVSIPATGDQYNPDNPSMAVMPQPIYPNIPPPPIIPPFPPFYPPHHHNPFVPPMAHYVGAPGAPFNHPQQHQQLVSVRTRELVPLIGGSGGSDNDGRRSYHHHLNPERPIMHPGFTTGSQQINRTYLPKTNDNNNTQAIDHEEEEEGMVELGGGRGIEGNDENDLEDEYEAGGINATAKFDYNRLGPVPSMYDYDQGSDSVVGQRGFGNSQRPGNNLIRNKYGGTTKSVGKFGKIRHNENRTLELRKIPTEMNTISQINGYFQKFGQLINIQVNHDNDPQSALITFSTNEEAYRAYKCQDPVFNNRFVKIFWHRSVNKSTTVKNESIISSSMDNDILTAEGKEEYTPMKVTNNNNRSSEPDENGITEGFATSVNPSAATPNEPYPSYTPRNSSSNNKFKIDHKMTSANDVITTTTPDEGGVPEDLHKNQQYQLGRRLSGSKDRQRKEALELQQSLEKKRYELLLKQIQNQKMLITKMEQNPSLFSPKEKASLIRNLKALMATITKLKGEIDTKRQTVKAIDVKSIANMEAINTKKELLDIELELMTRQAHTNDIAAPTDSEDGSSVGKVATSVELETRVAVLRAKALSMGILLQNTYSPPSYDVKKRKRNFATYYSTSPITTNPYSSHLDRRPKSLLVKDLLLAEERSQLATHISQTYGIRVQETLIPEDNVKALELLFNTRKEAEKFMAMGIVLENEPVKLCWGLPSQPFNPNKEPTNSTLGDDNNNGHRHSIQESEYSVDYTLSVPAHIVNELGDHSLADSSHDTLHQHTGTTLGDLEGKAGVEIDEDDEENIDGQARSWRP